MTSNAELETLERLVARTRGRQPWRRLFHAANGTLIAAALVWLPISRTTELLVLSGLVVAAFAADWIRLTQRWANELFFRLFNRLASPREAAGVASSTWYILGITAAVAFAPEPAAISGILVMSLADPAASYLGRRWGRRPFLGGSLEGSVVFVAVALAVLLPRHSWPVAVPAAFVAMLVERKSWPLDDNLTVPLITALLVGYLELWM